uniref:Rheacalcin-2-like n=1 Tax=Podarcis muralis TaxID=64176 RepID=A0A670JBR2_PODMU|nr:rheacalcin-2-like isoform X1 [Podarcis muralis]
MSLISCFHCVLLGLLATDFFPRGTKAVECPTGWLLHGAYCYGVFSAKLSWKEADEDCMAYSKRGHLASILSSSQGAMISSHLQTLEDEEDFPTGIWIGLHDPNKKGYWKWADRSILNYSPWSKEEVLLEPGTPTKGGCVYLSARTDFAKFHIAPCSEKMRYMCKMMFG